MTIVSRSVFSRWMVGAAVAVAIGSVAWAAGGAEGNHAEPSQLRRLTESQYRQAIADIFGPDIRVVGRFEPDLRVEGLIAVGASAVSVTPGGFEQYEEIARGIAAQVTDDAHRDKLVGCGPGSSDPQGMRCAEGFFSRVGLRLYRRPLSTKEARAFAAWTVASAKQLGSFQAGLAAALTGMLTSPDFLFRIDAPAAGGREIDAYSKAARLSFLLWNSTPDDALLAAAADGSLDSPEGLQRQVERLMASPRYVDGVRAFFTDYLQLDTIDTLSKDSLIYPAFTSTAANAAREQTLRTITDLLVDKKGDFRTLFTSRRIAMTRELGPIYDIPIAKQGWYFHEFPENDPRAGLLTHASILALHSHPGRTSPTLRGKALRETLLCQKVPTPPANVNFAVVQDVNNPTLKTTRARLQAHLDDEECASCHKLTDPMGLGLEQFDGAGQFRTLEHDERIDVTGTFDRNAFDGAAALGKLFHDKPQVSACMVKTFWRYASGRDPQDSDMPAIEALTQRFASEGYRLTALTRAIVLDPGYYAYSAGIGRNSMRTARVMTRRGDGS